jgi:anti-sigma B factor antagonist
MQMQITEVEGGILNVALTGRLDSPGVDRIETRFTAALVPRGVTAIVDLSRVEFAGSMAIRMFITVARALGKHHAKLVLYAPQPLVNEVFETVLLRQIVPVQFDSDSALAAARS